MSGTLRVLMYHRVLEGEAADRCNPSLRSATPGAFAEQMAYLARHYHPLRAEEVLSLLRAGRSLPRGATLVTFDDGCRDFAEVAWPVLQRHRIPATVFVPTAYPGHPERIFWWDRLHAAMTATRRLALRTPVGLLPLGTPSSRRLALKKLQGFIKSVAHADAMRLVEELCEQMGEPKAGDAAESAVLGWDDLRALAADGVTLAAHTRTHPALTRMSSSDAREEIRSSADDLRREIGSVLPVFAYPFGDHDERVARIAREEGFELAFTCRDGHARLPGDDPLRLPRTGITPRTSTLVFGARLTEAGAWLDGWRHRPPGRVGSPTAVARLVPGAWRAQAAPAVKVAYIMSRFPKLSETFVLNEMEACAASGIAVEVYPLLRERQAVAHPEVDAWVRRAHFEPFLSTAIVADNLRTVREQPARYFRTWAEVLGKTWRSPNFFVGALGIFPKTVRFARQMREEGVTHVHAHFATHPALAAFIVHRLTGIPFSFTAHGSDLHVDRRMLDTKIAAAAFGVTVSRFNREVIVAECGEGVRDKVHVIHCGVNPELFVPPAEELEDWRAFQIACVASLEEVKGHRFLIEALALLRDRGMVFECHLVGEGPQRRDIQRRISAAGLDARIHLHGGQPRPFVARLLAHSHAAVLASHPTRGGKREGIPVALMEAMAAGLPVVATAISGIPELVEAETSGLLVPSGNAGALADALQRLSEDPELCRRLGRAARARVATAFNLHANALALARLFGGAAASAGGQERQPPVEERIREAAAS